MTSLGAGSLHGRALQVGADRQWAGIGFLQLRNGLVEIELADMADDQPPNAGFLGEALSGSMSARQYLNETVRVLTLQDAVPATLKTVVFGYLIGVTGCYFGMEAHGGTEGVGQAATRGVVVSIFLVLVSDVVLVRLIQLLTGGLFG